MDFPKISQQAQQIQPHSRNAQEFSQGSGRNPIDPQSQSLGTVQNSEALRIQAANSIHVYTFGRILNNNRNYLSDEQFNDASKNLSDHKKCEEIYIALATNENVNLDDRIYVAGCILNVEKRDQVLLAILEVHTLCKSDLEKIFQYFVDKDKLSEFSLDFCSSSNKNIECRLYAAGCIFDAEKRDEVLLKILKENTTPLCNIDQADINQAIQSIFTVEKRDEGFAHAAIYLSTVIHFCAQYAVQIVDPLLRSQILVELYNQFRENPSTILDALIDAIPDENIKAQAREALAKGQAVHLQLNKSAAKV